MKNLILILLIISSSVYAQFNLSAGITQRFTNKLDNQIVIQVGSEGHTFVTGIPINENTNWKQIYMGYAYKYKFVSAGIFTEIANTGEGNFTPFVKINYKRHGFITGYAFNVNKKLQSNNFIFGYMFDICR